MKHGKKVCKILKEIRQQIAEKNDIELFISECHFQGECKGTCPKCEAEVRYLEQELNQRRQLGKAVAVAGISLGMAGAIAGCGAPTPKKVHAITAFTGDVEIVDTLANVPLSPLKYKQKCSTPPVVEISELEEMRSTGGIGEESSFFEDMAKIERELLENELSEKHLVGETEEDKFSAFTGFIETMPEYPGGEEELRKFLYENLVYPKEAQENWIWGTVYVSFVIEKDGTLSNIEIKRGIGGGCDEEVVRVFKMMPKWKPGKQGEKKVMVRQTYPIRFKFED